MKPSAAGRLWCAGHSSSMPFGFAVRGASAELCVLCIRCFRRLLSIANSTTTCSPSSARLGGRCVIGFKLCCGRVFGTPWLHFGQPTCQVWGPRFAPIFWAQNWCQKERWHKKVSPFSGRKTGATLGVSFRFLGSSFWISGTPPVTPAVRRFRGPAGKHGSPWARFSCKPATSIPMGALLRQCCVRVARLQRPFAARTDVQVFPFAAGVAVAIRSARLWISGGRLVTQRDRSTMFSPC